ncbi:hypothetical protein G9A89_019228 [Geosiphon pyriformis]|nr:hypothetical protein G9A89_019228 [Geosiphon pyriformis]
MTHFLPYGSVGQQQTVNPQTVAMAEQELEMVTETFQRIVDSCYKKCIPPKYIEADLNKGESVCIDRCTAKFFEVSTKVGEALAQKTQQQQLSVQQQQQAQQGGGGGGWSLW